MRSALIRPLLALILLAGFGARVVAPDLVHRCPASGAAAHVGQHGDGNQGHRHQGGTTDRCECVGQSCGAVIAVPVAKPAFSRLVVAFGPVQLSLAAGPARAAAPHLLPYAQGPPAPALA